MRLAFRFALFPFVPEVLMVAGVDENPLEVLMVPGKDENPVEVFIWR
jgi:hypothetical protein